MCISPNLLPPAPCPLPRHPTTYHPLTPLPHFQFAFCPWAFSLYPTWTGWDFISPLVGHLVVVSWWTFPTPHPVWFLGSSSTLGLWQTAHPTLPPLPPSYLHIPPRYSLVWDSTLPHTPHSSHFQLGLVGFWTLLPAYQTDRQWWFVSCLLGFLFTPPPPPFYRQFTVWTG